MVNLRTPKKPKKHLKLRKAVLPFSPRLSWNYVCGKRVAVTQSSRIGIGLVIDFIQELMRKPRRAAPVLLPHLGRYLRLARDQLSDMKLLVQQNGLYLSYPGTE